MRFHDLDLNLLIALDALIDERSVSTAADRLHLSQSAMSGALSRLRQGMGDDLLFAQGRQMVLTPRALELGPLVKNLLRQIEQDILTRREFDPATSVRSIPIMASDYATAVCLGPAFREIGASAPQMRFSVAPIGGDPFSPLERGETKLLVVPETFASPAFARRVLFKDAYVCVAWAGNTRIGQSLDFDTLCALPHVVVEFERSQSIGDWIYQQYGRKLTKAVSVSNYSVVPSLIVGTERMTIMHSRLAQLHAHLLPLRVLKPPIEIPDIVEVVQWQSVDGTDEALMWVVETIAQTAGRIDR